MNEKKQYCGLDLLKFIMAVLVAARHMIQAPDHWQLAFQSGCSGVFHHCGISFISQDPGYGQKERMACGGALCLAHCEAVSALVRDLLAH